MKYLRKWNEAINEGDVDDIKDILQSWIDDFSFDIIEDNSVGTLAFDDYKDGIFYRIKIDSYLYFKYISIMFNVNNIGRYNKECDKLKNRFSELINHLKESDYKSVRQTDYSRYALPTQRRFDISIDMR